MKASERALTLARCFNIREDFTATDDTLPDRLFEELSFGQRKGSKIDRQQFDTALGLYYEMMGWNRDTGIPASAKLHELDLGWAANKMDVA